MKLRKLTSQDAPLMLEWMHDPSVVEHLAANFAGKTLEDCRRFIDWAGATTEDLHLAVADEQDEYMGTVSLKHIAEGTAEFAITVRACAMGKGYAAWGMEEILCHGLMDLGLKAIYWCVSPENRRAIRFYDKNGYLRTEEVPQQIRCRYDIPLQWYVVTK